MLFDLRGRGRRRTVQAVYLALAIILGGGLILFGVGAGNGSGGILNAFTGNGSGGAQSQAVSAQEKAALKATKANPNNANAWSQLVSARWTAATGDNANYDSTTGQFTAAGKKELASLIAAWDRYQALTKSPQANTAILAARAYAKLNQYSNAAGAWETVAEGNPNEASAFECLTVNSYAAGDTRKGDLAAAKAEELLPKANRTTIKQTFTQAKAQKSTAQQIAQQC